MIRSRQAVTAVAAALLAGSLSGSVFAQAADPHHPEAQTGAATQPAPPPPARGTGAGMAAGGGMGMAGMDMPQMMQMMQNMRAMQSGMMGGGMTEHVEGRIAFLRTELAIAPAQERAWSRFADALRQQANQMRGAMAMGGGAQAGTLTARLEAEERMLAARLNSVRAARATLGDLYASLSPAQKAKADELVPPHMGMMPMGGMAGMRPQR
jgi:hypothetical protein